MPNPYSSTLTPLPLSTLAVSPEESRIIEVVRKDGPISRADLARLSGWSRAKTIEDANRLIERGYLVEVGDGRSSGGRRPRLLDINRQLAYVVGVQVGATSLDLGLADLSGRILQRRHEPADVRSAPEMLLERVVKLIQEMTRAAALDTSLVRGIGIGVPGPVDFARGVLVAPPLMPGWEGFPIRDFLQTYIPSAFALVDNDVNILALAELNAGAGIGVDDFFYVKIGTGIGAGIVVNGQVYRGHNGSAGDIGHICADENGPVCLCGNRGCLETMAAGPAIARQAMAAATEGRSAILAARLEANGVLRAEDIGAAAREGDLVAIEIIRDAGQLIGKVLAGLVNFFNPPIILIGGGVSNLGDHLLASIRRAVLHRATSLATRELAIQFSSLRGEGGVTGAIYLVLQYIFPVVEGPTIEDTSELATGKRQA